MGHVVFFLLWILCAGCIGADTVPHRPFPQEERWGHAIRPSQYSQEELNNHVVDLYEYYRDTYLRPSQRTEGGYYIHSGGTNVNFSTTATVSEAHGYGMILFALMAGHDVEAKEYFDGMVAFFLDHPSGANPYNMSWEIEGQERRRPRNSATDGDLDIAYALILAHNQWGSTGRYDYRQKAYDMIIHGILVDNMSQRTKRTLLGDWDRDHYTSRTSDWMPAHFRAFADVTGDDFFLEAIDTVYALIESVQSEFSPHTGLLPDFITGRFPEPDPRGGGTYENNSEKYDWNACRVPWRIATEYLHHESPAAREFCSTVIEWLIAHTEGDPRRITAGYTLSGEELVDYSSVAFQAPFALAATVDERFQDYLDASWDILRKDRGNGVYVTAINLFSMLLISGNWWAPQG
ncbi:glycosyl hydrolase family 8 [Chitinivibrio alkaliphilus]|uniref:Glucanase n=1 Tax=Chitinivibrio alkaliphilus ACht1 TaxID=1313304 RepID=U7D906_9BACT|nr:glycosyl hydrolase family 8 [Chitinivibrio alkaliphilus]ERP38869.1 glycoside hydrolase, GH8 family [Chitinivibrio alkaliphilus ACht1]